MQHRNCRQASSTCKQGPLFISENESEYVAGNKISTAHMKRVFASYGHQIEHKPQLIANAPVSPFSSVPYRYPQITKSAVYGGCPRLNCSIKRNFDT